MKKRNLAYQPSFFEKQAWKNKQLVCGIDEAGRGPLAGPLVVGCVVLPMGTKHHLLQDSKSLTPKQLLNAYTWIIQNCIYTYALCSHKKIDTINIYQATLLTMQQAFSNLINTQNITEQLQYVLVDAMPLKLPNKKPTTKIEYFNFGESISPSIAAASIIAKVTRDRIMYKFNTIFPGYHFNNNKGYGTTQHLQALENNGISLIHRTTFIKKLIKNDKKHSTQQQSIFA